MPIKFNAEEVLDMAAQIERNGGVFYRHAAKNNEEGRELLLRLAEQEDEHLALFERMRDELTSAESEGTAFDPYEEASLYLKAMADAHVFDLKGGDPTRMLKGDESLDDIIHVALRAEADSIAFFLGMKDLVPDSLGRDRVDSLIKEEMKHIRWLHDRHAD